MKYPYTHILVRYGELALKGKNQNIFLRLLKSNIQKKLGTIASKTPIYIERGYILLDVKDNTKKCIENIAGELREVCGIAIVSPAVFFKDKNIDCILAEIMNVAGYYKAENKKFSVRVRRADKTHPIPSGDLERMTGKYIQENTLWKNVDLRHPDKTFYIDIVNEGVFVYAEKEKGIGGLPVGIEGKVLSLLSGGIDSPVASFYMARRGCKVDFIHFTANKIQHDEAVNYKVAKIAQILSRYTLLSKLYLFPYIHFNLALVGKKIDYELVLFRRFMARVGEVAAKKIGAKALVTGDNLGQVASQTLSNIVTTSRAVEIPIFRPLLGFDKNEIINMAKKIGTYELSIKPYKDCCSLISKNPKTHSDSQKLEYIEKNAIVNYNKIIEDTLSDAQVLEIKNI